MGLEQWPKDASLTQIELDRCIAAVKRWGFVYGQQEIGQTVWDLYLEAGGWSAFTGTMEGWIKEGEECANWLKTIIVMGKDSREPDGKESVKEAVEVLTMVERSVAFLEF